VSRVARRLARLRVPAGFAAGAAVLWLARPTWGTLAAGAIVAAAGQALRGWAAGHLEKGREVTRSGPYRWMRHPLYAGASLMAVGLTVAARDLAVAVLVAAYLGVMLTAAIRSEEATLRARFGPEYDAYAGGSVDRARRFSLARARRNREHRAVLGLIVALLILGVKAWAHR
jgi:protein-S-isoprenylcysteine O-methyltransferase Ste14